MSRRIPHRVGNTPREQKKRSRNSLPERGIALSDRTPQASRNRTKPAPLSKQNSLPAIKTEIKTKKWVDNKHSKNFLHAKIEYQVNKTNEELENGKENREQSEPISNRLTTSAAETSTRRSQTESEKTWQNHEPVETEIVASDENLSNDHVIDKSPELVDNTIKYSSVSRTEHNERKHDHGASFEIPSSHIKSKHYETRKLSVMISNKNPSDTDCKRANLSSSENDKSESIENVKTPNESQKLKLPFSSKDTTKNEHSYDSFNNTKVKKQLENKERTRKAYKINSDIKLPNSKLKVSKANKQKANTTKEPQTVTKYERKVSADIAPGLTHGKNGSQRDSVYESGKSTSPSNGINISKSVQINDSELVQETEMPDKRTRVPIVGASPSPSRKLYHNSRFPNIEAAMKMKLTDKVGVNTKEKTTVQERISAALNDKTTDLDKEDDRSISPEDTKGKAQWKDLVNKYLRTPIPVIGKTTTKVILETNDESDDDSDIDIFERAIRRHKLNIDDDDDDDDDDYDDDDDGD